MNLMKYLLFFMLLYPFVLQAQNAPCSEYAAILKKLENTYQNGKGNLDECLDLVESLRACDPNKSELAGTWTKKIFAAIKKQKQDALDATRKAEMSAAAAKKARIRADSIADAAQRAAQRAYANDIAYKSQIALKDGDRTTAYRLAEFAHRYVDNDNLNVTHALVEALYYNDVPDTTHRLPWTANFQGHTSYVSSVAFSPDGSRLATGSYDNTAKIWEVTSTSSLAKLAKTGVTWRTPDSTTHLLLLASLTLPQLTAYNLESLLDQHPDNEEKLIASGETWQIAAFADLYAEKIAKSLPRRADYERAQRLYAACLRSGVEEEYFKEKVEELERVWKERGE